MKYISLNLDRTKDLIMSLTNDGGDPTPNTSELLVSLPIEYQQELYFSQSAAGAVSVDWGDGSEPDVPTDLQVILSHEYTQLGDYTIKITCADGETWTPGFTSGDNNYSILGLYSTTLINNTLRKAVLKSGAALGNYSFASCSALSEVVLPQNITYIPNFAFALCYGLTSINISNGVTGIGQNAFRQCLGLEEIILPDVTTISNAAFSASGLKRVVLGSKLIAMAAQVFSNCEQLEQVVLHSVSPPTLGTNVFANLPDDCIIYVPSESVEAYKTANRWSGYATHIQAIPT